MMTKTQTYAAALYAKMDENAEHGENGIIWRGEIVDTSVSVGIPIGSYNRAINYLRKAGCVEQLARGSAGGQPSIFRLIQPPTPEVWDEAFVKSRDRTLTSAPSLDMLHQQVRDISRQIGGINIAEALANFERRLAALEGKLDRFVQDQTAAVQHVQDNNTTQ